MDYVGYRCLPKQVLKSDFKITTEVLRLFGFGENYSKDDIISKYMPMVKLLASLTAEHQALQAAPYVIGVAGSVAVGKSTASRIIKYLLEHSYTVALVPTDGFLYSNEYLKRHNLEERKGFPESYDMKKLLNFLTELKQGRRNLKIPCYSHHIYDTVKNEYITINKADIVIIEGLNVLQSKQDELKENTVSNFIDFGIYVDADTDDIAAWFLTRFMMYRDMAKNDPSAYFYNFKDFSDAQATHYATAIWEKINLINLTTNILPSRSNADLIVAKDSAHSVTNIYVKE